MKVLIEERAQQVFLHLSDKDAKNIERCINVLMESTFEDIRSRLRPKKLFLAERSVFSINAKKGLRILFSYGEQNTIIIEDILSSEVLHRLIKWER